MDEPTRSGAVAPGAGAERARAGRERILRAAGQLFAEEGYEAVTMRGIAGRLGITAPGLYAHYPSKAAILADFVETELKRFLRAVETGCAAERGPIEKLGRFASEHVLQSLAASDLGPFNVHAALTQLTRQLPEPERQELLAVQRAHLRLLTAILAEGVERGLFACQERPTVTAFAILSMCDYVTTWFRPDGPLSPQEVAGHHRALVLRMVGAWPS